MRRLMFVLPAVACAALVLAACGDDDDGGGDQLTLDAYFTEVERLASDYSTAQNEAFSVLNESNDVDALKDAFAVLPESLESLLDGIKDLDPPEEAIVAQDEMLETGQAFLPELQSVNDDAQDTADVESFVATAGDDELQDLNESFKATCTPMQQVADDNAIEADLTCSEW